MRITRCFGVLSLPLLLGACDRSIVLGDLDSVGVAGASSGGTGAASGGTSGSVVFSSDFETGDLSEWGETGSTLAVPGGELAVLSGTAHGGSNALRVTTEQVDEHVVVTLDADYPEFVFGFWMRLTQTVSSTNWVILNLDETFDDGSIGELFDVALAAENGTPAHLLLWEKPALNGAEGSLGTSGEQIPLGLWWHVEVAWKVAADGSGRLQLFENGQLSVDLPSLRTSTGGVPRLSLGSFAYGLEPLPATLWLDDISLSTP